MRAALADATVARIRASRPEHRQRIFHERHKDNNRPQHNQAVGRKAGRRSVVGCGDRNGDEAGILRLDFKPKDEKEKTADGLISRFHKFVSRSGN